MQDFHQNCQILQINAEVLQLIFYTVIMKILEISNLNKNTFHFSRILNNFQDFKDYIQLKNAKFSNLSLRNSLSNRINHIGVTKKQLTLKKLFRKNHRFLLKYFGIIAKIYQTLPNSSNFVNNM